MPEKICFLMMGLMLCSAAVIGPPALSEQSNYSPFANRHFPQNVYWGDTHLHTTNSLDARIFGVQLDPDDAYRFARGETVFASNGEPARLSRPLDFLVITDHSDALGVVHQLVTGNRRLLQHPELRDLRDKFRKGGKEYQQAVQVIFQVLDGDYEGPLLDEKLMRSVWEDYVKTADHYNVPGQFSAIIGYEWTPTNSGDKLHRNVIYRDNAEMAGKVAPFTANNSMNPQDLWVWMENYEQATGGNVLALAHNGNLSNGQMFPVETNPQTGAPIDTDYVTARARWEPLFEVTQMKGDSESHPYLSPKDEFADFAIWDRGNATMERLKTPDMLQYEYAREALKNGLKLEQGLGVNPFRFGMVGSTDSHTALATAEENNYFGKMAWDEPRADRANQAYEHALDVPNLWQRREYTAAGYAAVWAHENTRESLFDAMQRREVYATTGPRITVRFFGGWDFDSQDDKRPDFAAIGYEKGTPMGGDLTAAPSGKSPEFLIVAGKDAEGANLDRIQIIKGWLDKDGQTHETVYNVALSDNRKVNPNGKVKALASTVDVETASYTNSIGEPLLSTVWEDPQFNASERAFYYVRVLEIPTPRWTTYDAAFYGTDLPTGVPSEIQERAYTSPIWYTP